MESGGRNRSRDLITSKDLIFEILLRLPTKSLMRFKATCKFWNSIISDDPDFAELHRRTWIQKPRLLFRPSSLVRQYWIYEVREHGAKAKKLQRLPFRHFAGHRLTEFEHSSGALLLLQSQYISEPPAFYIYDTISGNQIALPGLAVSIEGPLKPFLMFDASISIYKVLMYGSRHVRSCCVTRFCNKTNTSIQYSR